MSNGWVKIHRSIWDNPFMQRPNVLSVWLYILCHVVHQPTEIIFEGKRMTLQAGQGVFRFTDVAETIGVPAPTVYRIVDLLKNEKQIDKQKTPRNTLVTVLNWCEYQTSDNQNEKQVKNKRETNDKQMRNLHYYTKNDKNEKNDKKVYGTYQNVFLTDEEIQKLKAEFPDWQERIDRLSEYIESKGAKYKNHLATIRSWARRDKQNANMDRQPAGKEPSVADYERVIREAEERRKAGLVGAVPVGSRPAEQGVRTYPWQQRKSTV